MGAGNVGWEGNPIQVVLRRAEQCGRDGCGTFGESRVPLGATLASAAVDGNCCLWCGIVLSCPAFIPGQQLLSSPMEIPPKVQPLAGLREFSWGGIEGLGCDPLLGKLGFMERRECTEPSELSWKVLLELWLLLWKGPNTGNSLWDQGTGTRRAETRPWLCHGLRIALRVSLKVTSKKISS